MSAAAGPGSPAGVPAGTGRRTSARMYGAGDAVVCHVTVPDAGSGAANTWPSSPDQPRHRVRGHARDGQGDGHRLSGHHGEPLAEPGVLAARA